MLVFHRVFHVDANMILCSRCHNVSNILDGMTSPQLENLLVTRNEGNQHGQSVKVSELGWVALPDF
jgi:hypothetical protein